MQAGSLETDAVVIKGIKKVIAKETHHARCLEREHQNHTSSHLNDLNRRECSVKDSL